LCCLSAFAVAGAPCPACAAVAVESAREHFERGYALAQAGSFEAAIDEFKQAYAASPNFSVLFNLAQAYGAAGRAVQATHTLERYLELGGANIDAEQHRRVTELIQYYRRRIGRVALGSLPAGAVVRIDGQLLGTAPFDGPQDIEAGPHALSIEAPGYQLLNAALNVAPGVETKLAAELRKEPQGSLALACALPNVTLRVDGEPRGTMPLATLPIAAGQHRIALSRPGYVTTVRTLEWSAGQALRIDCRLEVDAETEKLATLRVAHPPRTEVWVDGRHFKGERLPAGAHQIAVSGTGFETTEQRVELQEGKSLTTTVVPRRDGALLDQERRKRVSVQKLAAYALGGAGVLTGGVALTLGLIGNARYADWKKKDKAFTSSFAQDPSSTSTVQLEQLLTEENSIRNEDALALGLGVAAGTLLATSAALYLTAGSNVPTLTITPKGEASVSYRVSF